MELPSSLEAVQSELHESLQTSRGIFSPGLERQVFDTSFEYGRMAGQLLANTVLAVEHKKIDSKTGLIEYSAFVEQAEAKLALSRRAADYFRGFAVMILDLDNFKKLNDTLGHPTVDAAFLIPAARAVQRSARADSDLVGRFGGEEFVVLLDGVGRDESQIVASHIHEQINSISTPNGPLGISIGVALGESGDSYALLLNDADAALLDAKHLEGKNQTVFFTDS